MYIVMIASECAPVAKVGGLADVVYGLSRELEVRGNSVEIIIPKYDCMRYDHIFELHVAYDDLMVPFYGAMVHCTVFFGYVHGRKCFFIDPHNDRHFFNRGLYYGHYDDPERFAFFSRAALEFLYKSGKNPDIIHCHDWQTGLVPVILYDIYEKLGMTHPRVCYTLHNLKHQGVTGGHVLNAVGLNDMDYYFQPDRLLHHSNPFEINLMKGGIVYSNFTTTVSPHYAFDIRHTDQGYGLGHTLYIHSSKFGGVLNGIDYDIWNPEIDSHIPFLYSVDNLEGKWLNREALRRRFMLRESEKPIVAYVGRLDHQKGVDLIEHAIRYCLSMKCQFVLLGSGVDRGINDWFMALRDEFRDNPDCHLEIGFDEELSHLIYAGADMFIVPSLFEPCGLTQMIALKYGTIPIVRETGGLKDTVFDVHYSQRPVEERNGFVFERFDGVSIENALRRAFKMWAEEPEEFRALIGNAMRLDYSWNLPGGHYLNIYNFIKE